MATASQLPNPNDQPPSASYVASVDIGRAAANILRKSGHSSMLPSIARAVSETLQASSKRPPSDPGRDWLADALSRSALRAEGAASALRLGVIAAPPLGCKQPPPPKSDEIIARAADAIKTANGAISALNYTCHDDEWTRAALIWATLQCAAALQSLSEYIKAPHEVVSNPYRCADLARKLLAASMDPISLTLSDDEKRGE